MDENQTGELSLWTFTGPYGPWGFMKFHEIQPIQISSLWLERKNPLQHYGLGLGSSFAVKTLGVLAEIKLKVSQECAWQQGRPHAAGLRRVAIPPTQCLLYHIELLCIVLGYHKEDIDNLEWVHLRATGMLGLQSCYSMRGSCFQRLWSFCLQRFSSSNRTNPWASWSDPTAGPALSKSSN